MTYMYLFCIQITIKENSPLERIALLCEEVIGMYRTIISNLLTISRFTTERK